jgi:hypothetical protein
VEGQREENHPLDNDQPNGKNFVLPADISPVPEMLPTASSSGTNSFSRRGSAAFITGSPHEQKLLNCMKKTSANHSSGPKKSSATQRKKRTRMPSSSSSDEVDEAVVVSTDDEADSQCQYCRKYYSGDKHGEKWLRCTQCYVWCHEKICRDREKKRFLLLHFPSVNDDLPQ